MHQFSGGTKQISFSRLKLVLNVKSSCIISYGKRPQILPLIMIPHSSKTMLAAFNNVPYRTRIIDSGKRLFSFLIIAITTMLTTIAISEKKLTFYEEK